MEQVLYSHRDENFYLHHTRTSSPRADEFTFRNHSHNMYEIYYFISGQAAFVVEGAVHPLKRGALVLTACGQAHHTALHGDGEPYERIALLFSPKALPEGYAQVVQSAAGGANAFLLDERSQIWFEEMFESIASAQTPQERETAIRAMIALALGKIARLQQGATPPPTVDDEIVGDILRYIRRNLGAQWTLDDLAKSLYRSKAYLNRRFRRVMGCSIWEYVLQKRIFAAQQHLYYFGSVSAAFENSGFQDYSVFYRQYKKYIGLSPSEDLREWNRSRKGS